MPMGDSKLYRTVSDIGKAASVGASIGLLNPIPALATFGADKGIRSNAIKSPVKPIKQSREMLAADLATLRSDPQKLGLSDAEQEKMRSEAVQTASAQNQAQSSQLAQAALAGQGFQQGAFQNAQADLGESAADAGVKAGANIRDLNNRIIESKKADIMSRLDAEREKAKENTRFWLNLGIQGVGAIIGAAMGAPSPIQGLTGGGGSGSSSGGSNTTINLPGSVARDLTDYSDVDEAAVPAGS